LTALAHRLKLLKTIPGPAPLASLPRTGHFFVFELLKLGKAVVAHALGAGRFTRGDIAQGVLPGKPPHVVATADAATNIRFGEKIPKASKIPGQAHISFARNTTHTHTAVPAAGITDPNRSTARNLFGTCPKSTGNGKSRINCAVIRDRNRNLSGHLR
jgi:hypothetical protein